MRNISDVIENYLKSILDSENRTIIEIKRNEIADKFQCVPSQINYVINTRFTMERGYKVESKRGGGGFIRIIKIQLVDELDFIDQINQLIDQEVTLYQSEQIIHRLLEESIITEREARIMYHALLDSNLTEDGIVTNQLRAVILKSMITSIKYI